MRGCGNCSYRAGGACDSAILCENVQVGPLFDSAQADRCLERMNTSGGEILCGGQTQGNLLLPTLVERPDPTSDLVREGLFGPALWIAPGERDEFAEWWLNNRFPLCAGVFSPTPEASWWQHRLPNLARLCINGDPSLEYPFEPWGGYPASGVNPVGTWREKYLRVLQIDAPVPAPAEENRIDTGGRSN